MDTPTPNAAGDSAPSTTTSEKQPWRPSNSLETAPVNAVHRPHGTLPNTPLAVSLISFLLGLTFALGVVLFAIGGVEGSRWLTRQFGFFVASLGVFHWAEFAVTAGWNRDKVSVDSFLLNNGAAYHIANAVALLEYIVEAQFFPKVKMHPSVSYLGFAATIASQALRSTAMISAASNFSHSVAYKKLDQHKLVTTGVYSWFRHPSYTAFFYWGLGSQLVLQNPISFLMYAIVIWRFFAARIPVEEKFLIKFFGDDYIQYRKRTGTFIPFIR